jgi:adenylosuccinate lyase
MEFSYLEAISPVDGRYRRATQKLADYFSEGALIKYRVLIEVEYFIALCELPLPQLEGFNHKLFEPLRAIYKKFSLDDGRRVKDIEKTTNHDVKAVEYFLKEKFDELDLQAFKEFIHFALTSQDINNTALPLSIKQAWAAVVAPLLNEVIELLQAKARQWKDVALLARTHGQPASPTSLGKEIYVFVERLRVQTAMLDTVPYSAKFGGATGNFNALPGCRLAGLCRSSGK